MDRGTKISPLWMIWIIIVLLVLLGAVSLIQIWTAHQGSSKEPSSTEVLNPEPVAKETQFTSQVNLESNPASSAGITNKMANPEAMAPGTAVTANKSASVQAPSYVPGESLQGQVAQQEAQETKVIPINAPMTDQQILEAIQKQNQRQQTIQQITASRDTLAVKVMHNVKTAQSQSVNSQQVIPSDYPKALPPADIVAKLKSHQLTAH